MKRHLIIVLLFAFGLGTYGCKQHTTEPSTKKDSSLTHGVDLTVACQNLKKLRNGEYFLVWLRYSGDPTWHVIDTVTISYMFPDGSDTNLFHHKTIEPLSNITEALVSLETSLATPVPTYPLLHGTFMGDTLKIVADITTIDLGDFTALTSSLVFTTTNAQATNDSEFYLCHFDGATFSPSLENLPVVPTGWKYALWAIDSGFFPTQRIFYGTFTKSSGHDSDSTFDSLLFPGGAKAVAMNQKTGAIIVTLEPDLYTASKLISLGPSQFSLLRFNRQRLITRDSDYVMTNVTSGLPVGTVTIARK